jgi:hypothetical protein
MHWLAGLIIDVDQPSKDETRCRFKRPKRVIGIDRRVLNVRRQEDFENRVSGFSSDKSY